MNLIYSLKKKKELFMKKLILFLAFFLVLFYINTDYLNGQEKYKIIREEKEITEVWMDLISIGGFGGTNNGLKFTFASFWGDYFSLDMFSFINFRNSREPNTIFSNSSIGFYLPFKLRKRNAFRAVCKVIPMSRLQMDKDKDEEMPLIAEFGLQYDTRFLSFAAGYRYQLKKWTKKIENNVEEYEKLNGPFIQASIGLSGPFKTKKVTKTRKILLPPPNLYLRAKFSDNDYTLINNEQRDLVITIDNKGKGIAENVKLYLQPETSELSLVHQKEHYVGNIPPFSQKKLSLPIKLANYTSDSRIITLSIDCQEKDGFTANKDIQIALVPEFTLPPSISMSTKFSEPSGNGVLDGRETGMLNVTLRNDGPGVARGLTVHVRSKGKGMGLQFKGEHTAPRIAVNSMATLQIPVHAKEDIPDGQIQLQVTVYEPYFKAHPIPAEVIFTSRAKRWPRLVLYDFTATDDPAKSPNGRIERNESVDVSAVIQNTGEEKAEEVAFKITSDTDGVMLIGKVQDNEISRGVFKWDKMDIGNWEMVTYRFFINAECQAESLRFQIIGTEKESRFGFSETKMVAMDQIIPPTSKYVLPPSEDKVTPRKLISPPPPLAIDVDINIPETHRKKREAVAVVIGNQNYTNMSNVDFATRDAWVIRDYLEKTFGYDAANIFDYTDATKTDFEGVFGNDRSHKGKLYHRTRRGSEVFIYYSGHGYSKGQDMPSYFVPADVELAAIEVASYSLDVLYKNLCKLIEEKQPMRLVVVIESCFSGYLSEEWGISSSRWEGDNPLLFLKSRGAIVMTASSGIETAKWYKKKQHGMFTYFLLKAFQNSANEAGKCADKNRDKKLTLGEIKAFILDRDYGVPYYAPLESGDDQTPVIMGDLNSVLLKW